MIFCSVPISRYIKQSNLRSRPIQYRRSTHRKRSIPPGFSYQQGFLCPSFYTKPKIIFTIYHHRLSQDVCAKIPMNRSEFSPGETHYYVIKRRTYRIRRTFRYSIIAKSYKMYSTRTERTLGPLMSNGQFDLGNHAVHNTMFVNTCNISRRVIRADKLIGRKEIIFFFVLKS